MQGVSSEDFCLKLENKANLILSGKQAKLTPDEKGYNKTEPVALGSSHQQHWSGCLGNSTQLLGLLLFSFFYISDRSVLIELNKACGRPVFGVFRREKWSYGLRITERGIFGNLSLCQPQSIFVSEYIFMIRDSSEELLKTKSLSSFRGELP